MNRHLAVFVLLIVTTSAAFGLDEVLQKYKHRYLDIEEADVDKIGEFLTSPHPEERGEAATQIGVALGKGFSSAGKFIPVLIRLLRTDNDQGVKVHAASALRASKDPRAVEPLLEVARDTTLEPLLRETALHGLSRMRAKNKEIEEIAVAELDSPDYYLRYRAIDILGGSTNKENVEKLVEAYIQHYESPDESLKNVKGSRWDVSAYDDISWIYSMAIGAALQAAPGLVPRLINHPIDNIRMDIASVLAIKTDDRAIPLLINLSKSVDPDIRKYAVEILGYVSLHYQRKNGHVIQALKDALNDKFTIPGRDGRPYRVVADMAYRGLLTTGIEVDEPEDLKESRPPGLLRIGRSRD